MTLNNSTLKIRGKYSDTDVCVEAICIPTICAPLQNQKSDISVEKY